MDVTLNVSVAIATTWGFLCGLYVSYSLLKGLRKAAIRRYIADLRRAKRINIDIDTQVINQTTLLTRVTVNGHRALLLYVSSETPLHYSVNGEDGALPADRQTTTVTMQ